jgi:hypothetical protein
MYRRDDEKLHYRDGEQAEHFSASQGAEQAGFSAQDGSDRQIWRTDSHKPYILHPF